MLKTLKNSNKQMMLLMLIIMCQLFRVSTTQGKKKDSGNSGNSRPTQGTFMNKVNNLFIWRNTCIELRK